MNADALRRSPTGQSITDLARRAAEAGGGRKQEFRREIDGVRRKSPSNWQGVTEKQR